MAKQIPDQDLNEIEEIVRRHPDGVTFKEIADALKTRIPPRTLQYRLRYLVNEKRLVPERDRRWRKYRVRQDQLDALRRGITLDGIRYGPIEAQLERQQGANVWLVFGIREGKNREVKNVLGHLGLAVNRLIRVSFGPFQLGDLPEGAIEEVRTRHLREQLGEGLVKSAGVDFSAPIVMRELDRSIRASARSVGAMPPFSRTSSGSPKISRRRLSAVLIAGCDWFSRIAVRDTLRSVTSVTSTRSR